MRTSPFFQSVRVRLMFWNMLVLALVLLILGGILRIRVERSLIASVDGDLANRSVRHRRFWAMASWMPPRTSRREDTQQRPRIEESPGKPTLPAASEAPSPVSRWRTPEIERIFNLDGTQNWPPGGNEAPWDKPNFKRALTGEEIYSTIRVEDDEVRIFYTPLRLKNGQIAAILQEAYSLADVDRALSNVNSTLLTLIPVALAAVGFGGMFLTGRMLRPVRAVTQAAERIGAEDLSRRLNVRGQDEFSQLAATFNAMLARLEQSFEQQRRFTADASHELRTPLTVIKANASLALSRNDLTPTYRKGLEKIDRAADVMNRVVQDLLLLARSDAGQLDIPLRPIPLWEVLETAVLCVQPQAGERIRNLAEDSSLFVEGDPGHLTRLFVNLLENAVRYTPEEGSVTLSADQEESVVIVTVEDTGIGIAPEHLPHICERFYRVDEARSRAEGGTGLGLAICQSIVRAHGGSLDITSHPGSGTSVRVTLRVAQRDLLDEP